jgi:hypothetical protein
MNNDSIKSQLEIIKTTFLRLKLYVFLSLVLIIYIFVGWKAVVSLNANPNLSAINKQSNNLSYPKIDPATLDKINQLQDNSVSVQSLFNQARQNPFQE